MTGRARAARRYWTDMKRRIRDEGFREVYALCVQLRMRAPDGKERTTDAVGDCLQAVIPRCGNDFS